MSEKIAFLDRDGVINEKAAEHDYIKTWSEFNFKTGAIAGIKLLKKKGYKIVIISNQRGIARGMMSKADLADIHRNMQMCLEVEKTSIDAIYFCAHEAGTCNCRKPAIGLFIEAEKQFQVDKDASFMIGDSKTDIEAGENYGIRSYYLNHNDNLYELLLRIEI